MWVAIEAMSHPAADLRQFLVAMYMKDSSLTRPRFIVKIETFQTSSAASQFPRKFWETLQFEEDMATRLVNCREEFDFLYCCVCVFVLFLFMFVQAVPGRIYRSDLVLP